MRSTSTTHALPRLVRPGAEWRGDLPASEAGSGSEIGLRRGEGGGRGGYIGTFALIRPLHPPPLPCRPHSAATVIWLDRP
jgi:hypothetical protein